MKKLSDCYWKVEIIDAKYNFFWFATCDDSGIDDIGPNQFFRTSREAVENWHEFRELNGWDKWNWRFKKDREQDHVGG